jgi:amino acid adenylation domain-containing protein
LLVGSSTSDISVPSETRREDGQQTRHAAGSEFHRVTIVRSGSIADLQLCHEIGPPPSPREVQISVKAASVMLADLLCVRGLYPTMPPYPFTPGFEVAGTVAVVGDQVVEFQPGDRVCGLTGANLGGHSGRVNVDPRLLVRINESLTFSDACTLPVSFLTANHSLFEIGRLSPEETLLIHSAASCTGLMAIQLAQRAGVRIFATVGSAEKIDYLRGIGVADVFDYRSRDLITELREAMPGGKVDVVLNLLTGPIRNLSLDLLSPGGRFLDLAVAGLKASAPPDLSLLVDNQGYFGVDCRRLSLRQPSIVADALKNLSTLVVSREIRPLPVSRHFALSEVRSAYELLESRTGIGRVILLPIEENFTSSPPGRILDNTSIQERLPKPAFEPIAVIGMAGRFPDAPDLATFWQNLVSAKSSITEVGAERWPGEGPFRPLANSSDRYWGGFLDGIDEFDAPFFNIARAEAEMMDPQHRLFLQEAWKALEDAGYSPRDLAGESCGIFVGIGASDYYSQIREPDAHSLTGNLGSALVGRLAYLLDWTGPCLAVDTACASSFSAVHLACASLGRGECHLAMAGGVHIAPSPKVFVATTRMGLLSPTGRCQTFDATADGWVIGEGLGVVILKRLQDAVRDGDHIHGVIRGCGINQDGAKNGFTAPKAESQTALQGRVYQQAGVNPETIDYIEVHGMSSLLGDEIELHALKESFASFTRRRNFCQVGSLKPNIGHPIAAAGIACLLKVLLALRHRKLPSVAGLKKVNDALGLDDSPFYLNAELVQWKRRDGRPRRAAVNGLSASGANCHLIVDEYVSESEHSPEIPGTRWSPGLFVLSAGAGSCLRESASNLLRFFEEDPDVSLPDVAFTLQVGRQEMDERLAFVAESLAEAKAKLSAFLKGETSGAIYRGCVEGADSPASLLASGDEGKHFIAAAIRNQALDKLGQLWTAGVQIDWSLLYQGPQPKRLSLPTYPFARERYWLQQPTNFNAVGSSHEPETKDERRETVSSDTSVIDLLRDIIAGVLRCSSAEIDPDRDLFRYGFGSLYVLRVADQFEAVTGVRLPGRVFYQGRTIREIVRTVPDRMVVLPNERIQPAGGLPAKGGNGNSMGGGAVSTSDPLRPFPLSEGQKALWSIQRSRPGSTAYHVPVGIFWNEPLDLLVLERAWQQLGQEQPALRTTFGFEVNEPFQVVHEKTTIRIEQESLVGLGDIEIRRRIREIGRQPFDLEKGPLWRVQVFPVSLSRNILLVSLHHLIFDGHSLGLLLKGLEGHYRQILSGSQVQPGALPKRFGDYVQSERRYLASETFQEDLTYWVKQFPHGFAPLGITESSANRDAAGEVFQSKITHSLVEALERLANQECVTLPSVFLTAFETILAVAGRQQEVVAGVAVDLRPPTGFEEVIGFFVNIVPIATNFSGVASFRDLLRRVFDKLLDSLEHRRLPFRRLVQALAADVGGPGDLQAAFYFHAWRSPEEHHFADRLVPEIHQAGEFDLVFEVVEASTDWLLNVKYRPGVFGLATIKKLITRFQDVLEIAARNPDDPVADLPREVRPGFAEPATSGFHYPRNRCVYQLIEDQVGRTPDAVAVLFEGSQLRYGELDARANQLAHHLVQAGVGPGSLIGVMLDRSLELPECLLAVWKTGAAYVPLDPGHPKERIEFILGNARVEVLLTHSGCRLRPDGIHTIEFDRQQETIRQRPIVKPLVPSSPEDLAYVIYTSGSTGKPKGVQIAHRSLTHFLWSMAERPGCTSDDYLLAATTICFDIAALELFLPLVTGARVEILPEEIAVNGLRFKEKIESSPATLIQGTPATWKMLLAAELGPIPRVKALCGGEAWGVQLAEQLLVRAREVWNMYGPTETTVWSSIQRVEPGQSVHLGDPIGNTQFYVFDESMRLVQPGEIGELFIGGDGLAKGYLNRPDLTGERFVPNPLRPEEIIYKTGDLVRHV